MWRRLVLGGAAAIFTAAAVSYVLDIRSAYDRVAQGSDVVRTDWSDIEFSVRGSGPAVLVVHGSGGGYDQAELIADAVLGDGFRTIAPSRFGYLRSTLPDAATWDDQAHAYAGTNPRGRHSTHRRGQRRGRTVTGLSRRAAAAARCRTCRVTGCPAGRSRLSGSR